MILTIESSVFIPAIVTRPLWGATVGTCRARPVFGIPQTFRSSRRDVLRTSCFGIGQTFWSSRRDVLRTSFLGIPQTFRSSRRDVPRTSCLGIPERF
ncbi:MAG: hypothetical protein Q8902_13185, partial [Bacteroidota bacterium]|nr:hypothetical protein [Bacteroidota bacterium]